MFGIFQRLQGWVAAPPPAPVSIPPVETVGDPEEYAIPVSVAVPLPAPDLTSIFVTASQGEAIVIDIEEATMDSSQVLPAQTLAFNPIENYFSRPPAQTCLSRVREGVSYAAKGLTVIEAVLIGGVYIPVARSFTTNIPLGWLYGISSAVCAGGITVYAFFDLINKMGQSQKIKLTQMPSWQDNIKKYTKWVVSIVFGAFSAIPSFWIGYTYTGDSLFWGSVLGLADFIANSYSLGRFITTHHFGCGSDTDEVSAAMVAYGWGLKYLDTLSPVELKDFFTSRGIDFTDTEIDLSLHIGTLFRDLKRLGLEYQKTMPHWATDTIPCALGSTLPFSWLIVLFMAAFQGSKAIFDNVYFNAIVASISFIPASLLEIDFSKKSYSSAFSAIIAWFNGRPQGQLSSLQYPILNKILNGIALGFSSFAFSARTALVSDFFSSEITRDILIGAIIVTTVSYKSFSLLRHVDDGLCTVALQCASQDTKQLIRLKHQLEILPYVMFNVGSDPALAFVRTSGCEQNPSSRSEANDNAHVVANSNGITLWPARTTVDSKKSFASRCACAIL